MADWIHLHIHADPPRAQGTGAALSAFVAGDAWRFVLEEAADLPPSDRAALLFGLARAHAWRHGAQDTRLALHLHTPEGLVEVQGLVGPPLEVEPKWWGWVDVLAETRAAGLYQLNLRPGGRIPTHVHRRMREAELVLTDQLTGWWPGHDAAVLPRGRRVRWDHDLPHGYQNDADSPQAVLCLDRPPFDPADEVLLEPDAPAPAGFRDGAA